MQRSVRVVALFASLMIATPPALAARAAATEPFTGAFTGHLADLINGYRQRHGLAPLALAEDLAALANEHSSAMSDQRRLSHDGFRARFRRASSRVCVENVAWNFPTPEALLEGWRRSPDHHRNLLEPKVARMGIGVSTRYVTLFACL